MNFERKMDFIVENLAALTVSQQTTDARLDKLTVRLDSLAVRQEKTDRQMRGLQTLVKTGMRMMVSLQKGQRRTDERIADLAESQRQLAESHKQLASALKRTDERFDRWLDSMNKGSNGHKRKPNNTPRG